MTPRTAPAADAPAVLVTEAEVEHYTRSALDYAALTELMGHVDAVTARSPAALARFPDELTGWLDAPYDQTAQAAAYRHVGALRGARVLQLGGTGTHVVKMLIAGAALGAHVSPVAGECAVTRDLARRAGVADRLVTVVGLAEQLPFAPDSFDAVYSGGCLHHTVTALAVPQARRVLAPGGRFAAHDPWRAPFYNLGVRVLGQRERDVHCTPLDAARTAPVHTVFDPAQHDSADVTRHGAVTRYPMLALWKLGIRPGAVVLARISRWDEHLCRAVPVLRRLGSSVTVRATKAA